MSHTVPTKIPNKMFLSSTLKLVEPMTYFIPLLLREKLLNQVLHVLTANIQEYISVSTSGCKNIQTSLLASLLSIVYPQPTNVQICMDITNG